MHDPTTLKPHKLAYRIDEAVNASGLGRTFLYERIASGELKSIKVGGRRLILREDWGPFILLFAKGPPAGPQNHLDVGERVQTPAATWRLN